jgi:predicted DCC family thiol-disulfide oxidoreductase YuxK
MISQESESGVSSRLPEDKILILFDGYCNLCNGAVQFVLKRDRRDRFRYASLSWPVGDEVIRKYPKLAGVDSIIVYQNGKVLERSSAALFIAGRLGGLWPMLGVFWVVPKLIRDGIYNWIARNRYRWFGKKDSCMIPDRDVSHLFLKPEFDSSPDSDR